MAQREYKQLPNEDDVRAALKSSANTPAMYFVPHIMDKKTMGDPENQRKFVEGPIALVTIRQPGPPKMGPYLIQWFILSLVISVVAGYLASRTVPSGARFLARLPPHQHRGVPGVRGRQHHRRHLVEPAVEYRREGPPRCRDLRGRHGLRLRRALARGRLIG